MRAFVFSGLNSAIKGNDREKYLSLPLVQECFSIASSTMKQDFQLNVDFNELAVMSGEQLYSIHRINLVTMLIVCMQVGVAKTLIAKGIQPDIVGGISLGDAARTVIADAVDFTEIVKITNTHAEEQKKLDRFGESVALLIKGDDYITDSDRKMFDQLDVGASQLSNNLLNISGGFKNIKNFREYAIGRSWKIIHLLNYPVHSNALNHYSDMMRVFLETLNFRDAKLPIFSSTFVKPIRTRQEILDEQTKVMTHPHHWKRSVEYMTGKMNVTSFVNIGPDKTLYKSTRNVNPDVEIVDAAEFF